MQTWAQFLLKKIAELEQQEGRRVSNKEFGAMLGYSPGTISLWLNGKNTPDAKSIPGLADKLGLEVYEVLGLASPEPELRYISRNWENLPEDARRRIREIVDEYVHDK